MKKLIIVFWEEEAIVLFTYAGKKVVTQIKGMQ